MRVCVFGANGATGEQVVTQASSKGWRVTACVHGMDQLPEATDLITYRQADVLTDELCPIVRGHDAVVSALGVGNDPQTLLDPPPLYTEGTANIVRAMEAERVDRLVVISASFVEAKNRGPWYFKVPAMIALHRVFEQMKQMEAILRNAPEIKWTAVRPGWLMEGAATRDYVVEPNVIPKDLIRTRHADLAQLIVACLSDNSWVQQTPAIARREDDSAQSLSAVMSDMAP